MRILVTGGSGFIGSAIVQALAARGHQLVVCVHRADGESLAQGVETIAVDYMRDLAPAVWMPRIANVDVVINAVGILRERPGGRFSEIHHLAPRALFRACEHGRVRRVIQVSALGADAHAGSRYHQTKHAADEVLRNSPLNWTVVQPSVVFGPDGASTQLFLKLASLPMVPLVGNGRQPLQPIHIDDLTDLMVRLVEDNVGARETVPAVGPRTVSMREMLASYRQSMGMNPTVFLRVPLLLIRLAARIGDTLRSGALSTETLRMLLQGSTGSMAAIEKILGRPPRDLSGFIQSGEAHGWRARAVWTWLRPLLLASMAGVWILGGLMSWLFFQEQGMALLSRLGMSSQTAHVAFLLSCLTNVALGILTILKPGQWLWRAQLAVMVFYTLALTWVEPALWIDPFGPLIKNLPLAVVLLVLMAEPDEA